MAVIRMTRGLQTVVDDMDLKWARQWSWCSNEKEPGRHYAYRSTRGGEKHQHLHREILARKLGRPLHVGEQVDHINGDTLDNRRVNLRPVTIQQQRWNMAKKSGCRSCYKGVKFNGPSRPGGRPRAKPWLARVTVSEKTICLGYFITEGAAAVAYNEAAKLHFGEYARLNQI